MASTLPTCFALSFLSSKGSRGSSPRCETVMSCSSQAYYPQIIPRIQQLGLLTTSVVKKASEEILDVANEFSSMHLACCIKDLEPNAAKMVKHTLQHPCHMTISRIEMTKVIAFIYIIDDIFDIHGSPDELNLFLDAISKWELSAVDILPTYMKCCYIALYDITNEIAQSVLKEQGWNPINSLKKAWTRLCNAFLLESRWLQSNQLPKSDEYLKNAIVSSGVHAVLMHAFFLLGQGITKENVSLLERNPTLLSCPATILRLRDDLGSAKDEHQDGFDGSYVECYMKEYPECSTQDARDYVKQMIANTWRCFNKECFSQNPFAPNLVTACLNIARMVEVMYSYDENGNIPSLEDYIRVLLYKSI
ncbi:uncharacterized protein A4U43_C08F3120 [Asparagus officinalis]|nr:uncharacterized protein A4U43_C08F3120 [Asparagus officinalis]